jgi:hypothetical protein
MSRVKTVISKDASMSFPLVGNLSEKTRRIADKSRNARKYENVAVLMIASVNFKEGGYLS